METVHRNMLLAVVATFTPIALDLIVHVDILVNLGVLLHKNSTKAHNSGEPGAG